MDITIQPGTLTGEVLVPSSKSILHRLGAGKKRHPPALPQPGHPSYHGLPDRFGGFFYPAGR